MGAVNIFSASLYSLPRPQPSASQTHLSKPIFGSLIAFKSTTSRRNSRFVSGCSPKDPVAESAAFFDENGAVDDMDGYLNSLPLEYDSVWDTKPSWCQPWTIALTGVSLIGSSWLILHSVVVTTVVLSLICLWWYIFLYSYPKAYSNTIEERKKKVNSGIEDTYGVTKSQ